MRLPSSSHRPGGARKGNGNEGHHYSQLWIERWDTYAAMMDLTSFDDERLLFFAAKEPSYCSPKPGALALTEGHI